MQKNHAARLTVADPWFRYWLPYTFVKLEAAKLDHVYLPLNRNYKPLGMECEVWVDYQGFIGWAVVFSDDPHTFSNVWYLPETLYLYGDSPKSRVEYFDRLDRLLSRSVKLFDRST